MRFLLLTQWPIEESTSDKALLKKTSEEGLDLVFNHSKEGATATVTYKVLYNIKNLITFHKLGHIKYFELLDSLGYRF